MKRPGPPPGDLLNLPLTADDEIFEPSVQRLEAQDLLPFDTDGAEDVATTEPALLPEPLGKPGFGLRLKAGLIDLALVGCAIAFAAGGAWIAGVAPTLPAVPGLVVFAVSFSFLYTIVPLVFWSQTPGMAFTELAARGGSDVPLSIQQAIRRWLGAVLTILLCGLPAFLTLTGRSVADRLSKTDVIRRFGEDSH
jgi:hypothetical protein